jgi:hypothetical protein
MLLAAVAALPASPRLPAAAVTLPVPAGLAGFSLPWQSVHLAGAAARTLTNGVATGF